MMQDKRAMRMKAMDGMMREKPSISMKRPMEESEMPEEGMVSMAVTPEEKEMILAAREQNAMGEEEEMI